MANKKVFVSGTYDILHAGHIKFFKDARALGGHLTVCSASSEVIKLSKKRTSALPDRHKLAIIGELRCVDKALISSDLDPVFDFLGHWKRDGAPDILAVTDDDRNAERKRAVCRDYGVELVVLPKTPPSADEPEPISTTAIRKRIKADQGV
ncbi:MAG: adenylyltransferase/cytidyltransferase family protein [Patescibacteria group bacterium]|nr:adenylyltransferase/cytidyltransferase family protein [Patescibacteria group bacterium]